VRGSRAFWAARAALSSGQIYYSVVSLKVLPRSFPPGAACNIS